MMIDIETRIAKRCTKSITRAMDNPLLDTSRYRLTLIRLAIFSVAARTARRRP